jgi:hypothetical protein
MVAIRTYTPEENMRRVRRQRGLSFVVVEGCDDVPIYESCLMSLVSDGADFDVVSSGGKTAIRDFLQSHHTDNSVFIIDKDFNDMGLEDERLVSLDRYSIENFFICEEVISCSLQFVLKCKLADVRAVFSLDEFSAEIVDGTTELMKVLFYYQRHVVAQLDGEEKISWSNKFLCVDTEWKLCRAKITELIGQLLPEGEGMEEVEFYYQEHFHSSGSITKDFPGKMLKHALQRYVRQKLIDIRPSLGGKFNDVEVMKESLAAVMYRSTEVKRVLTPVVEFIDARCA